MGACTRVRWLDFKVPGWIIALTRHQGGVRMSNGKKVRVAVVGLGFGAEFIPLYQKHPDAECYAICQRDEKKLNQVGDMFKVERQVHPVRGPAEGQGNRRHPRRDPHRGPRPHVHRGAGSGQARLQHRSHGHDGEGMPEGRRGQEEGGQGLHDDGDRRLHAGVPLREGDGGQGRAGQDPVPPRVPPAEHEPSRLARLLVRLSPHALCHPRGEPAAVPDRRRGGVRRVLRVRDHPRGVREEVRLPLRHRDAR